MIELKNSMTKINCWIYKTKGTTSNLEYIQHILENIPIC